MDFSLTKKNNNNKITKQKCAETGEKQENVNTEKNVNTPTVTTNYNLKEMYPNITKQEIVNYFTKKVLVPTEQDVCSCTFIKIKWKKFLKITKPGLKPNYPTVSLKKNNNPDSVLPNLNNKNKNNNLKHTKNSYNNPTLWNTKNI